MKCRVRGGRSLRRRRPFRRSVVEQGASPVVCLDIGVRQLVEGERLPDAPAKLGGHKIDLVVQTGVAIGVSPCLLDTAATLIPLLAHELEVHAGR